MSRYLVLVPLFTLAACQNLLPSGEQRAPLASWVELGEQGQIVVRAVTDAATCPNLQQDGQTRSMQLRAPAQTIAQRLTASPPQESKPSAFPVLTCEAIVSRAVQQISIAGQALPLPKVTPQRIVLIGDSGCRLKSADHYFQNCNEESGWAFQQVAEHAAALQPDLVIHVGDYHYRENPCPQGNAACTGSPWGYGWDVWQADFFRPAQALLRAAPWVMVRGNHESCARAGQGWWRFLDPRALQNGRDCNREQDDMTGDYSDSYAVAIGSDTQFLVFDSAKMPYKPVAYDTPIFQRYLAQFRQSAELAKNAGTNLFLSHHPALGWSPERQSDGHSMLMPAASAMQSIMQQLEPLRLFPQQVQYAISGHVHAFEEIVFSTNHPTQYVTGNGGSSLEPPMDCANNATPYPAAQVASFRNTVEPGFTLMERKNGRWTFQPMDRNGRPMADAADCKVVSQP